MVTLVRGDHQGAELGRLGVAVSTISATRYRAGSCERPGKTKKECRRQGVEGGQRGSFPFTHKRNWLWSLVLHGAQKSLLDYGRLTPIDPP